MQRIPALLILGLLVAGCGKDAPPPEEAGIPAATFTEVLAELSVARVELLPDTAAYRARRAAILIRAGVTAADMRDFVDRHGGDADLMSEIYERVGARLDSAGQR